MSKRNHEITVPQLLLNKEGSIQEPGWSRQQIQDYRRCDIKAPSFRIKEWDYYLMLSEEVGVALTVSDLGYIGLQSVSFLNFKEKWEHTESILNAFPMGKMKLPSHSLKGNTVYQDKRAHFRFEQEEGQRHIFCSFQNFYQGKDFSCEFWLESPQTDHMVIATPFTGKKKAFYYNEKTNCMRTSGQVRLGDETYLFHPEQDFASLDWGRGVWNYDNTWYWGNGNCDIDGHRFGFNIGYGFGDNRAATENVLFYDEKVHKLDDITFLIPEDDYCKPWKFTSSDGRFEMDFHPILDRAANMNYLIIASDQHQVFGKMTGKAILDDGTVLQIRDCLCFAEKVHNRY